MQCFFGLGFCGGRVKIQYGGAVDFVVDPLRRGPREPHVRVTSFSGDGDWQDWYISTVTNRHGVAGGRCAKQKIQVRLYCISCLGGRGGGMN